MTQLYRQRMQVNNKQRLFVSLSVPAHAKRKLAVLQETLGSINGEQSIRWQSQSHLHITVQFLGNVPIDQIPILEQSLNQIAKSVPPINLGFDNVETVPAGPPARLLWVRVKANNDALENLIERSERHLRRFGDNHEQRSTAPHITIGRRRITGSPISLSPRPLGSCKWKATSLDLIRSITRKGTLDHMVIHRAPFNTPEDIIT